MKWHDVEGLECGQIGSMYRSRLPPKSYRSWPRPRPRIPALRLSASSVRFIALAILATGVRAFECALSSLTCSFDHGLRCAGAFFVGMNNLLNAHWLEETRRSVIASRSQKGVIHQGHFRGQEKYSFGRSVKGGLAVQPSTRPR
jgi:hypothetical protein